MNASLFPVKLQAKVMNHKGTKVHEGKARAASFSFGGSFGLGLIVRLRK
jgi:hypothetical protein